MRIEEIKEVLSFQFHGFYSSPHVLQIEIITACPLSCPQCYKTNDEGFYMDWETYASIIDQATELKIPLITLNGGEPLCHPDFIRMIKYAVERDIEVIVYTSGWKLEAVLDSIAGISKLQLMISLNGSTDSINSKSRDGFEISVQALRLLSVSHTRMTYAINWVARHDNVDDLPNLCIFAKSYGAQFINIVCNKITGNGMIESPMKKTDIEKLISIIQSDRTYFTIQKCYGILWAMLVPEDKVSHGGCPAGISMCEVDVRGQFSPCTHLYYPESFTSIQEYWNGSCVLAKLRNSSKSVKGGKCSECRKYRNCRFCHAVTFETHNHLEYGLSSCDLFEKR